ncbi:MAG: 1-acyl-sn-glycerol-3-phosphate acyltransferase, partial [Cyanobacteria bacterium REEB65]|nr:1-acyl-sn-glycerol-3-phosphate acyltransferase [Cyanobacteria bacterium REEB65]
MMARFQSGETIAVVAALHREVAPLLARMSARRRVSMRGCRAWQGAIAGRNVVVVVAGIGLDAASWATLEVVRLFGDVQRLVSAGYCGGLDPALRPEGLVIADSVLGTSERIPVDPIWPDRLAEWTDGVVGPVVSISSPVRRPREKAALRGDLRLPVIPAVADMEALAVGKVAAAFGIPFTAVKVVLDSAAESLSLAPWHWPRLARVSKKASARLGSALLQLVGLGPERPWPWLERTAHWLFGGHDRALYPTWVEGLENLPPGPKILACNHQSWLDVCCLYSACPFQVRWVAKSELFGHPILRWFVSSMGAVRLERGQARNLDDMAVALARGAAIVIFPEGTIPGEEDVPRSAIQPETGLLRGKSGAVRLA